MLAAANFHYVRDSFAAPYPSIFGVTPDEFRSQLRALGEAGEFVGAERIVAALDGRAALPERAIAITFDDGLAEQCETAWPILQEMGIPAIFYLNTGCIADGRVETVHKIHLLRSQISPDAILDELHVFADRRGIPLEAFDTSNATVQYKYDTPETARLKYTLNFALDADRQIAFVDDALARLTDFDETSASRALYMSAEQARSLDASHAVGSHGHRHVVLGRQTPGGAARQVRRSVDLLREWGCSNLVSFSYPYGSFEACPAEAADAAAECGLRFAFTMERAINHDLSAPMFLSRFANNDMPGGDSAAWTPATLFDEAPAARWRRAM